MAQPRLHTTNTPPTALEEQFPGFRPCFGGEELRRAQASMSCLLVGGTIQALTPSNLPPSLAKFSASSGRGGLQPSSTQSDAGGHPVPRSVSMPARAASLRLRAGTATEGGADAPPPAAAVLELEHLADAYQEELDRLEGGGRPAEAPAPAEGMTPHGLSMRDALSSFDAAYGLGVILQDLAARTVVGSVGHMSRLREACEKYRLAVSLRPAAHSALYNWGVALSELARALKPSDATAARQCLQEAAAKYARALAITPDTPQALNNWGLVLQELSSLARSRQERDAQLREACLRFRQAIRTRPDFDRGCYNLGTVCYAAACLLQGELAQGGPGDAASAWKPAGQGSDGSTGLGAAGHGSAPSTPPAQAASLRAAREAEVNGLFASAAQYICLAYALQHKDIYKKSLGVVRRLLPLPFLRAGYLMAPLPSTNCTPEEAWRQDWYVLDAHSLRSATSMEGSLSSGAGRGAGAAPAAVLPADSSLHASVLPLQHIRGVARICDPSLPHGAAFCLQLHAASLISGQTYCMVAEDEDAADAWVDALQLAAHVVQTRSAGTLMEALTPTT